MMNTLCCDKDECDCYSFFQPRLNMFCSLLYSNISGTESNFAGPALCGPNKLVKYTKNRVERRPKEGRLTTSIFNKVLSMCSSESADYESTGCGQSVSNKTCDSHVGQSRTNSEYSCSEAHHKMNNLHICSDTKEDVREIGDLDESCLPTFSLNVFGCIAIKAAKQGNWIKASENLSIAFLRLCLSLAWQKCNDFF